MKTILFFTLTIIIMAIACTPQKSKSPDNGAKKNSAIGSIKANGNRDGAPCPMNR
jgi:hypothetical protein